MTPSSKSPDRAGRYQRRRLGFYFLDLFLLTAVVWGGQAAGLWRALAGVFSDGRPWIAAVLFVLCFHAVLALAGFPVSAVRYALTERAFGLSNETWRRWAGDVLKEAAFACVFVAAAAGAAYGVLLMSPRGAWFWLALGWAALAAVLTWILPVWILPHFYPMRRLASADLEGRLKRRLESLDIRVEGLYELKLSRKTRKANAAVTGLGRTKRILMGDTLLESFSPGEIETVLCHEAGHYRLGHTRQGLAFTAVTTAAGLYVFFTFMAESAVHLAGAHSLTDPAFYPFLFWMLTAARFLFQPAANAWSRARERQADAFALRVTGLRDDFISAMRRLAGLNLAVINPHPVVEFWFYTHPSIGRRIRFAQEHDAS